MLLNTFLQRRRISTNNLLDLLAILEKHKSRHGAHAQFLRDLWDLVDVDFVETGVGEFVRKSAHTVLLVYAPFCFHGEMGTYFTT